MKLLTCLTLLLLSVSTTFASDYNYITPEEVKENITGNADMLIVDIQVEKEFKQHHVPGSIATFAYPVKSDEDQLKLNQALKIHKETGKPVVIVCPRGAGGAKRTYDYLKANGVQENDLSILKEGMAGWPYKDLTLVGD